MTASKSFENIVRRAINESGLSRYQISKQSGVPESVLSRFVSGKRSISLDTLEKLRAVLHLELRLRP
jgi:transcriptional regulator with XRE-family HTH domain